MSDMQDEAYSEAMDEIERLNQLNDALIADKNRITEIAKKAIADRDTEIERLNWINAEERATIDQLAKLCLRAADALGAWRARFGNEALISELRKAAQ